jgi:deoxyadenosine/deoxycytidine kinase
MSEKKSTYIAVAGNIGAGKTTLVEMLQKHYNWEALFETVDENPYLNDFYTDMQRWSFNLQIYFLNSRFEQSMQIKTNNLNTIQDRTIYEDCYIFADNLHDMGLMTTRDYHNYLGIFENIKSFVKPPDLLVYLKASVPTLVNQIQKRGRAYESGIRIDYLQKLNDKYEKWISNYKEGKLLVINVDKIDFVEKPEDLGDIIEKIEKEIHGLF